MADIGTLLSNFGSEINGTTESLGTLEEAISSLSSKTKKAKDDEESLGDGAKKAAEKLLNLATSMVSIQNQMDELQLKHDQFNRKWAVQFQQFEWKKKEAALNLQKQEIELEKGNISIMREAYIKMQKANLAYSEFIDTKKRELDIALSNAELGIESAKLGLRSANIAAAKADLDYQKQLLSIEGNLISSRKAAAEAAKNYVKELEGLYEPWIKLSDEASTYTKTIGGSKESMEQLKNETLDFVNASHLQAKYNTSAEELIKLQTKYNEELGRSIKLTGEEKEGLAALKQVFGDEKAVQFATKFTNFGYDIGRASGIAGKMFANASKHGISISKYSKNLLDNIKMAQTLTFDKGVKGLQSMAEKATELNFNMQETSKAADKLSTLEGSMEAAAKLSVLGGNFAQFSNPLAMMNEAINDAEGLQDRIVNMFSSSAHWDSNKGEISMSGYDRLRMNEAAKAMGMDPAQVSDMVFTKARKDKLSPEIENLRVDDDIKRLLSNVAQLDENGKGFVDIDNKKMSLEEASAMDPEKLASILRTQNNSDSDNIKDIAQSVLSIKDNVEGFTKSLNDSMSAVLEMSGMGKQFSNMVTAQSTNTDWTMKTAEEMTKAGKEQAEFNKKSAAFNYEYATKTYELDKQQAQVQREQTLLAAKTAANSLESAKLNQIHAEYAKSRYPLDKEEARIQKELAQYAGKEGAIQLAQLGLSLARQKLYNNVELPMEEERLNVQFRTEKRLNDIYGIQRYLLIIQATDLLKSTLGSIPIIGNILGPLAGLVGDFTSIFALIKNNPLTMAGNAIKDSFRGVTGVEYNKNNLGPSDDVRSLVNQYNKEYSKGFATGGVVRNDRKFYDGGVTDIASIGGVLVGPTHADGGVTINAQGGEYIMPVEQTNMYRSELESMRSKTFPVGNGSFNSMDVYKYNGGNTVWNGSSKSWNNDNTIKLEISGTISLDCSGNTANIDARSLMEDRNFIQQITEMITKTQITNNNLGLNSEKLTFATYG